MPYGPNVATVLRALTRQPEVLSGVARGLARRCGRLRDDRRVLRDLLADRTAERDSLRARDTTATAAIREALRLLDDWQTAEELGTVEEWAVQISATLAPLAVDRERTPA